MEDTPPGTGVDLFDMTDSFESEKAPIVLVHYINQTNFSNFKNQVTSISWDVSSLQTNLQRNGGKIVTSTLESPVSIFTSDGQIRKIKKEHKEAVLVSKWNTKNKDHDIFASGGVEKKIIVSLNLTLLVVG